MGWEVHAPRRHALRPQLDAATAARARPPPPALGRDAAACSQASGGPSGSSAGSDIDPNPSALLMAPLRSGAGSGGGPGAASLRTPSPTLTCRCHCPPAPCQPVPCVRSLRRAQSPAKLRITNFLCWGPRMPKSNFHYSNVTTKSNPISIKFRQIAPLPPIRPLYHTCLTSHLAPRTLPPTLPPQAAASGQQQSAAACVKWVVAPSFSPAQWGATGRIARFGSRTEGTALLITDGAALQAAGLWSSPTRTAAPEAPL